jgi:hypothetical protein
MTRFGWSARSSRARKWACWVGLPALAGGLLVLSRGCGGGDTGADAFGPMVGAGATDASGGGPAGGAAGWSAAGTSGSPAAGASGAPDAGPTDGAGASGGTGKDANGPCASDFDCVGKPATPYCDTATGKCQECILPNPLSCKIGMYCDGATFKCVAGCDTADDCNAGDAGPITCNTTTHSCNPLCTAGQFHCECNEVQKCDPGPPPKWVPVSPAVVCNAASGQACDDKTGTCKAVPTVGSATATGTYYQYAIFNQNAGVFKGGYDVDGDGEFLYVNRSGSNLDVYKVELQDTDGDGKLEPNQHPDNPQEQGPMEKRVLTFVKTYTKSGDSAPLGTASQAELFAASDRIFSLGPSRNGDITEYIFATKQTNVVIDSAANFALSEMGYASGEKRWYGSNESNRRVYSYCPATKSWVAEFGYPNLAGTHMDGLEAIVSPSTQTQYVYVSDMTSDFLGQYRRGDKGGWVQENLFKYNDTTGSSVEGMGFGAFCHFWITGGSTLIEIGGGDLTSYISDKSCQ